MKKVTVDNESFCESLDSLSGMAGLTKVVYCMRNVYVGYTATGQDTHTWSDRWHTRTRAVLDKLDDLVAKNDVKVNMFISLNPVICCNAKYEDRCHSCLDRYAEYLLKVQLTAQKYPSFSWYYTHESMPIFYVYKCGNLSSGIAGGRNLTNSPTGEVSCVIDDVQCDELLRLIKHNKLIFRKIDDMFLENVFTVINAESDT